MEKHVSRGGVGSVSVFLNLNASPKDSATKMTMITAMAKMA